MNYIGSKYSLLPFLQENILEFAGTDTRRIFFDIFAGTGVVGRHFKKLGFQVIANDIQYYSYCLNRAYVGINHNPRFAQLVDELPRPAGLLLYDPIDIVLDYLNRLEGVEGFVYRHYCPGGTAGTGYVRQYFTDENGKRCDAVRLQIEAWRSKGKISEDEYFYLLASLIEAIDQVANTASVYGAFLKRIKPRALVPFKLERVEIVAADQPHQVYNSDGVALVDRFPYDILYMDPPYNQRQYCTNYHTLETIARYDSPQLYGITGLREYNGQKSAFCRRQDALKALDDLLQRTPARFVFLSYNSEGLMAKEDIIALMKQYGRVQLREYAYRRFRADADSPKRNYKADCVTEYLFCVEKS